MDAGCVDLGVLVDRPGNVVVGINEAHRVTAGELGQRQTQQHPLPFAVVHHAVVAHQVQEVRRPETLDRSPDLAGGR